MLSKENIYLFEYLCMIFMEQHWGIYSLSNREIIEKIGKKIRDIRLNGNITRSNLQYASGVHVKTIGDAEDGKNVTLITLVAILRGLNALHLIEHLVEDEMVSPAALYRNNEKPRERARGEAIRRIPYR